MSHRVIQWSTGNAGLRSLRIVLRHPELELVGLHAHSSAKLGKDAAELAGEGQPRQVSSRPGRSTHCFRSPPGMVSTLDLPHTPARGWVAR